MSPSNAKEVDARPIYADLSATKILAALRVRSTLAVPNIRRKKRHAGQQEENPAKQADHIPGYRYVSTSTERQQTKWVVFGILLWSLLMGILGIPYTIEINRPPGSSLPRWSLASSTGWWLTLSIMPLALSIAVLRYRLYEIDLIINRTLVYGSLTVTLVALYFGGIVLLHRVFVAFTGERSTLAVVASTLLIAALFNPVRRRIQSFIDRRFYRRKYDARKTLEEFSSKLRDETDLEALNDDLGGVVRDTMQPTHVSLWLPPETQKGK